MSDVGPSSLFRSVETGDLDTVRSLLDADRKLVSAYGGVSYWRGSCTALQLAVEHGNREMVELLLDRGADVNDKAELTNWAPLHLALKNGPLAEYLLARGSRMDIHAAAGLGDLASMQAIAAQSPDAIHARGPDGATPLHFAATVEVAAWLLDRGADIEVRDQDHGMTPLAWQSSNREIASLLMARGASVENPFLAAAVGDAASLRVFLDSDPSLIHATTAEGDYYGAGATLLHVAARNGHCEAVSLLWKGALQPTREAVGAM